jgi:hypothetical protein
MKKLEFQELFEKPNYSGYNYISMEKNEIKKVAKIAYQNAKSYSHLISSLIAIEEDEIVYEPKRKK